MILPDSEALAGQCANICVGLFLISFISYPLLSYAAFSSFLCLLVFGQIIQERRHCGLLVFDSKSWFKALQMKGVLFLKRWTYMKAWSSYKQNFTEATWILPPISLTPAYRAFSNLASSALRWGNLKRDVALWKSYSVTFRPHYTQPRSQGLFTEKALVTRLHYTLVATTTSHLDLCLRKPPTGPEITWLSWSYRFPKAPFAKCSLSTRVWKAGVFKSLRFEGRGFGKAPPFSWWRISVDGRPNRRNKAAFLTSSGVVGTLT